MMRAAQKAWRAGVLFCLCGAASASVAACARIDSGASGNGGNAGGSPAQGGSSGSGGDAGGGGIAGSTGSGGTTPIIDAGPGSGSATDGLAAEGFNCGLATFKVERLPPDVLIVLDRSGSMRELAKGLAGIFSGSFNTKWTDMKNALLPTVTNTQATVNWGLKLFPNDDNCGVVEGVAAPVAPNNAQTIIAAINGTGPDGGGTPTRLAIEGGGRYLMSLSTPNPRYIVLATDGLPNCSGADGSAEDDVATIAAVATVAAAGVPVFVIGVGTQGALRTQSNTNGDATLSAMARAGGKPRAADPAYYPVTTSADLTAALAAIGGQIVSCTLPIKTPPDPTNIAVDADDKRVPRSATDGWEYGPNMTTIQLTGSWCTNYQNGSIKNVQTIFGCPGIIIP